MSEVERNLEDIVRSMGVNIVDNIDEAPQQETVDNTAEESVESSTTDSSETEKQEDVQESQTQTEEGEDVKQDDSSEAEPNVESEVYRYEQQTEDEQSSNEDYDENDVYDFVNGYLSERLGVTIEDIKSRPNTPVEIDERLQPILDFMQNTGRSPEDWFRYQSLNPSEMDDLTVVKMQMMTDYPELSQEDVSMLISNKYKLDADLYDESDVKMATLQLKMDAGKSRKDIQNIRESYLLPAETAKEQVSQEPESIIDEKWLQTMVMDVDSLDAIDFDLPGGKVFSYGLNDRYRENLKTKNAKLDEYFDDYVDNQGRWDFEKLSMHRTVVDNIDEIVKAVYQQGMSDGQRKVVENTANIQTKTPELGNVDGSDKVAEQLRNIMGRNDDMMRFNL